MPKRRLWKNQYLCSLEGYSIDLEHQLALSLGLYWRITEKEKIMTKIMGLPLWETRKYISFFFKVDIFIAWKAFLSILNIANTSSRFFWRKTKKEKISNFWQKSWVNPFAKMPIKAFFLKVDILYSPKSFSTDLQH